MNHHRPIGLPNEILIKLLCGIFVFTVSVQTSKAFQTPERLNDQPSLQDTDGAAVEKNASVEKPRGFPNWKLPTFGGKQFWTDVRFCGGWRIQENSETGHFRLLDSNNVRQAWGNLAHCNLELDQRVAKGKVRQVKGKVVILLHGLMRTNEAMVPLAVEVKRAGYQPINFQYASTRKTVEEHGKALRQLIEQLGPEVTEINFVGHSMGNLVVRHYFYLTWDPLKNRHGDSRVRRMVMLGPPNQGSRMARLLKHSIIFRTLAGVSGLQLGGGWEKLNSKLAIPTIQFGIIAGGQDSEKDLSNFVLRGRDDFTVSVDEARLAGAHDFIVHPLLHSTMMHQPESMKMVVSFFDHGYFRSEQLRQPIPAGLAKTHK